MPTPALGHDRGLHPEHTGSIVIPFFPSTYRTPAPASRVRAHLEFRQMALGCFLRCRRVHRESLKSSGDWACFDPTFKPRHLNIPKPSTQSSTAHSTLSVRHCRLKTRNPYRRTSKVTPRLFVLRKYEVPQTYGVSRRQPCRLVFNLL